MRKFIIILLLLTPICSFAADLGKKDIAIINTEIIKLLEQYQGEINKIGELNSTETQNASSFAEGLLSLFINRKVLVYNDLDPAHQLSEYYEVETYVSNLILWYPDGIRVALDLENTSSGNIKTYENDVYSIDVNVKKKIDGNYLNKVMNTNKENLVFRIALKKSGYSFQNFRIVGLRNAASTKIVDSNDEINEMKGENISAEDQEKIKIHIKQLLDDYAHNLSLLGNVEEPAEDKKFYREAFLNLFTDHEALVYNDLKPTQTSDYANIDEYLKIFENDYPEGIKNVGLVFDSTRNTIPIPKANNEYEGLVYVKKFFSGKLLGKELFRSSPDLIFKIKFNKTGKSYADFKIKSVELSEEKFLDTDQMDKLDLSVNKFKVKKIDFTGNHLLIYGNCGISGVYDRNRALDSDSETGYDWAYKNGLGYGGGIKLQHNFTNRIGAFAGVEYNHYNSQYGLHGEFHTIKPAVDSNNLWYLKYVYADFDSIVNIDVLTVPLGVSFNSSNCNKIGYYIDVSIGLCYTFRDNFKITGGNYVEEGYYEEEPRVLQRISVPELGFDTTSVYSGNINFATFHSTITLGGGISFPLGYFASLRIGPEIRWGIMDISNRKSYTNIFDVTVDNKGVFLRYYGISLILNYKL
jgi:hypothetical protein